MSLHLKKTLATAIVLAATLISQQALAHAHLASASPANQAVIEGSPKTLTLTFTEGVEANFSGASITDAQGKTIDAGKASVDSADNKVLHIPVEQSLPAGEYKVEWHVLSVDGHKTKGLYHFTLK